VTRPPTLRPFRTIKPPPPFDPFRTNLFFFSPPIRRSCPATVLAILSSPVIHILFSIQSSSCIQALLFHRLRIPPGLAIFFPSLTAKFTNLTARSDIGPTLVKYQLMPYDYDEQTSEHRNSQSCRSHHNLHVEAQSHGNNRDCGLLLSTCQSINRPWGYPCLKESPVLLLFMLR